jgi:hypothetical protein
VCVLTLLLLSTAACGHLLPGKTVLVQRDAPPPDLTTCPAETPMPPVFDNEAHRYAWATDAILSGRACRSILEKLAAWATQKL